MATSFVKELHLESLAQTPEECGLDRRCNCKDEHHAETRSEGISDGARRDSVERHRGFPATGLN
jgi:hypothetical protein